LIELDGVVARGSRKLTLSPLTLRLGAGSHALLGGRQEGPSLVLALLAGRVRVRRGAARVLGCPAGDPRLRAPVAYVPIDVALPGPLRVEEALAMAGELRGDPTVSPLARLDAFGLGAIARRMCRTLAREEARAVALVEALASKADVILVEEPMLVDPRALGAIVAALRARAHGGPIAGLPAANASRAACVVAATGSSRDARSIADDVLTFDRGSLVRRAPSGDPLVVAGPRGACVRVLCSDPQRLAMTIAEEPGVRRVALEGNLLVAEGADVASVAAAVTKSALREGISVEMLRPDLLRDHELRSVLAGDAA
jgi:ABC-type multidrug transport system ATPase subunit